jgi:hypothetical protein
MMNNITPEQVEAMLAAQRIHNYADEFYRKAYETGAREASMQTAAEVFHLCVRAVRLNPEAHADLNKQWAEWLQRQIIMDGQS